MAEGEPDDKWRKLPKVDFDSKKLAKRLKKAETATVKHARKFIVRRLDRIWEVRRRIVMWWLAVGFLIASIGIQWLFYQQDYRTTAAARDGMYAEAVVGPATNLNPLFASSSAEQAISQLLFSRLLNYDTTGNLNYDLAESVDIDSKETTYTIKIRPDVKWHDGESLTAEDVAFTVGLIQDPTIRTSVSGWSDIVASVVDDYTISFKLPNPYAAFRHALTFPVLPEHLFQGVPPSLIGESNFSSNPIGSGPFQLRFVQDVDVSLERKVIHLGRNISYYRGAPKLEKMQLHVYKDTAAVLKALSLNEVNAAADLSGLEVESVRREQYNVISKPINSGVYALLNTKSDLLKSLDLRKALRLGADTEAVRASLPTAMPELYTPFVPGQLTGKVPGPPKFDQEEARKILDKNGWTLNDDSNVRMKGGKELRLSVVVIAGGEQERALEVLSSQWRELGIIVDKHIADPTDRTQNVIQSILQPRSFDVLIYQLNIGADPDVYAYWHSSQASEQGLNFSNYSNVISDDALSSARVRADEALRNAKYITFTKQWLSDVPAIGLYQSTAQYVTSKKTSSVNDSSSFVSSGSRYANVLQWSIGTRSVYKTP